MRAEPVLDRVASFRWLWVDGCLCRCRWGGVGMVSSQGRFCTAITWGAGEQGWAGHVR